MTLAAWETEQQYAAVFEKKKKRKSFGSQPQLTPEFVKETCFDGTAEMRIQWCFNQLIQDSGFCLKQPCNCFIPHQICL